MHLEQLSKTVTLPEGAQAQIEGNVLTVKGEKGELSKKIGSKRYTITVEGNKVIFEKKNATRKDKRLMNSNATHVQNMAKGTMEGHTYKLKICSGHFPMNVSLKDRVFEVKNFIGEAVPRRLTLIEGVDVEINGDEIIVSCIDKSKAGNQASAIELLTRRPGFDSRIFQDGIYITEKDGNQV